MVVVVAAASAPTLVYDLLLMLQYIMRSLSRLRARDAAAIRTTER